jgi:uncharacterized membrane protein
MNSSGFVMRLKVQTGLTTLLILFFMVMAAPIAPGFAHENHQALGAGPGPDEPVEVNAAAQEVPSSDTTVNIHGNLAEAHEMAAEHHEMAADEHKTFGQRLVSWLGRLHTLVIHFPIAMFVGALGVELFGLWRRDREYQGAAHVMLMVGAVGAVVAAALGWFAGGFYLTDRNQILMLHRWLGTAIAIAGVLLLYASARARRAPEQPRTIYYVLLGLMTVAIAIQGYIGGSFMHGGMRHLAF